MLPPDGFTGRVRLVRVHDARRVEVALNERTRLVVVLGGLGEPAPPGSADARRAVHFLEAALEEADVLSLHAPCPAAFLAALQSPEPAGLDAELWIGTENRLADMLIRAGLSGAAARDASA